MRDWVAMEVTGIRDLWHQSYTPLEQIFAKFRYVGIDFDAMVDTEGMEDFDDLLKKAHDRSPATGDRCKTFAAGTNNNNPGSLDLGHGYSRARTKTNVGAERLLSDQQIARMKDDFRDDAEKCQEDAIRLHHNVSGAGVPIWFMFLFAYFAYDDVFRMLMNPLLFYPVMLLASVAGMLYSMGLGPVMVPIVRSTGNAYLRKLGVGDLL